MDSGFGSPSRKRPAFQSSFCSLCPTIVDSLSLFNDLLPSRICPSLCLNFLTASVDLQRSCGGAHRSPLSPNLPTHNLIKSRPNLLHQQRYLNIPLNHQWSSQGTRKALHSSQTRHVSQYPDRTRKEATIWYPGRFNSVNQVTADHSIKRTIHTNDPAWALDGANIAAL